MAFTHPAEILRLRKTVRAACHHDDVDRAFATVLRLLSEAHGWAVAEAWVLQPDGSALEMAPVCYCRDDRYRPFVDVALGFVIDRGIGLPGSAWESREPVVTRDVLEEPRFARAGLVRDFGLRGALTVPVPAAEPVVILSFFDTRPRASSTSSSSRASPTSVQTSRRSCGDGARAWTWSAGSGSPSSGIARCSIAASRASSSRTRTARLSTATWPSRRSWAAPPARTSSAGASRSSSSIPARGTASWRGSVSELSLSDLELRLRRDDGEIRWILTNVARVDDKPGAGRVEGQLLDLTERKRNEDAQRDALRSVAALARATAHEILNPLNPLLGQLALLARELDDSGKSGKIDVAIRNAEAVRDIVRRMINITQLEFERRPGDVDALLDIPAARPPSLRRRSDHPQRRGDLMAVSRRRFLKTGALAAAAAPLLGRAPFASAQGARRVTKVLDFQTSADVAKAEQEGEVVYYGHDGEAGLTVLLDSFKKDFPKIKTSYVRLQTGALYAKITAERSANRFGVDVLQLSDISPAVDFQKKGGWEQYASPEHAAYKAEHQSNPAGYYGWAGVSFAGISYNRTKVKPEQAPKTWKDILNPAFKDGISAKLAASGMQHAQWYMLRKLYGNDFWPEFAKQRPKGFDARAQLFDRLSKGDDRICALAEYAGYTLFQQKGAEIEFVAPPDGLPATPIFIGVVNRAPHPEAAKLFVDWALSKRGQMVYQNQPILLYGSLRGDAGPMPTGKRLSDFKLLFPSDWNDYVASHPVFVKEWNSIMGL